MPIAVLELASGWDPADATSYVIPSSSPAANSYLVWFYSSRHGTTAPGLTPPSVFSSTWTELATAEQVDGISAVGAWGMQLGASPGTSGFTATVDGGVTAIGLNEHLLQITGLDTVGTVVQAIYGPTATTGLTPGLSAAAPAMSDANNIQLFFSAHRAADATTPEAGWTADTDRSGTLPNYGGRASWKIGSFDSSPTHTIASSVRWQSMYLELKIASGVPAIDPTKFRRGRRTLRGNR